MTESGGGYPEIDLIIAVHSADRPIERAVRSVLEGTRLPAAGGPSLRVSVVCHGLPSSAVAARLGPLTADPRLRMLEHRDGIRSPSGPFNAGIDAADGEWVAIMGSDDELESGALRAWLNRARSTGSRIVLPPIVRRDRSGRDTLVPSPPCRPGRSSGLDGVRDRLAYRSAPLGLMERSVVGDLRFPASLPQGEDVLFSSQLWFAGTRIALASSGRYIVHDDAGDRVTLAPRPIEDALAFVVELLDDEWFLAQPAPVRHALAAKLLRINVLGEFVNRPAAEQWTASERESLTRVVDGIRRVSPTAETVLAIADRRVLDELDPATGTNAERLLLLARDRRRFGRWDTVATRSVLHLLRRESPLRLMLATVARARTARMRR